MGNTLQKLPKNSPPPQEVEQLLEEFTCEICIEPTSSKFKNGDKCSHPFCADCMIKYIRVKLDHDNVCHIRCLALNCDHSLDPLACAPLAGAPLFVRWSDVLCEAALVDTDKSYCPHQNCNELILNECGGNPMKSNCPSCKRLFCFKCKSIWHAGFRCEDMGDVRDANDLALGRLAEQKRWMRCPRCRHFVGKGKGCPFVRCRCGINFCYRCGEQVQGHRCRCDGALTMCLLRSYVVFLAVLPIIALVVICVMSLDKLLTRGNK